MSYEMLLPEIRGGWDAQDHRFSVYPEGSAYFQSILTDKFK